MLYYIIKKGLCSYPPCLAQVMLLNDLGIDFVLIHGKDPNYINDILNRRNIRHIELKSDKKSKGKLDSIFMFVKYNFEINNLLKKIQKSDTIFFGNVESCLFLKRAIKNKKYLLNVLELYELNSIYGKKLKWLLNNSILNICCEKHRSQIMVSQYSLKELPLVMPNKPYDFSDQLSLDTLGIDKGIQDIIYTKKTILYQGIITPDRPLDKIALALKEINNNDLYFLVMGNCSTDYKNYLKSCYDKIIFLGYIPAPNHLSITKHATLGIANYDMSVLNNVFCAPNKIFEYSKYQVPMIASNNIGLIETVDYYKAGLCTNFNNVEDISDAIKTVLGSYENYQIGAQNLYDSCNNYKLMEEIVKKISIKK